jgi:hypothetical protein
MIFIGGVPHVVFEWTPQGDPVHLVALDPSFLHSTQGWVAVTHLYELPVQDPRLLS